MDQGLVSKDLKMLFLEIQKTLIPVLAVSLSHDDCIQALTQSYASAEARLESACFLLLRGLRGSQGVEWCVTQLGGNRRLLSLLASQDDTGLHSVADYLLSACPQA